MSIALRYVLFSIFFFLGAETVSFGGMTVDTTYTDRGKADFDTVLQLLNPYGTWSKIGGLWAYTPLDHEAPYTDGRWIYTEYGWYWKGRLPHSWATEHYGYWKRGADKVWSWYPGSYWLPEIVELRATSTHIGWRSAAVDQDGNFVEQPADRYAKVDEWTFVSLAQFANPITPDVATKPDETKNLLEDSTESRHTYVTYREIDRPGPHPADFLALCKDGGMFAPMTLQDQLALQPPPSSPIIPGLTPGLPAAPVPSPASTAGAPSGKVNPDSNKPAEDPKLAAEKRQVKYWITMSLPTFWTPLPPSAKPKEIYLYRPDFFQDEDGISRRIGYWVDPASRKDTKLSDLLGAGASSAKTPADSNTGSAQPAVPATPATPARHHDPFKNPLDDSFHSDSTPHAPSPSVTPSPSDNN